MGAWNYGWDDSDAAADEIDLMSDELVRKGQEILAECLADNPGYVPQLVQEQVRPRVMLLHQMVTKTRFTYSREMETYFRDAQKAMEHLFGDYALEWREPDQYRQAVREDIATLQAWLDRDQDPSYGQHDWAVALLAGVDSSAEVHQRTPASYPSIAAVAEAIPGAVTVVALREDLRESKDSAFFNASTMPKRVGYPVGAAYTGGQWVLVIPTALANVREALLPDGPTYPVRSLSPYRSPGD